MKVAFAHWENRIAPVFDTAQQIHVIDTKSGQILRETQEVLPPDLTLKKALRLVELGIGTLVCGAISRPMHEIVAAYGIRVVPFVAGNLPEVIHAWCRGNLTHDAFAMPGCRGWGRQRFREMRGVYPKVGTLRGRRNGMGAGGRKGQDQTGQRPGRMGGSLADGPIFYCVCPQCGQRELYERGVPCSEHTCPKCGIAMIRQ